MKEWKNKDVIVGLIVIIILGLIALFLLIRREINHGFLQRNQVIETKEETYDEEPEEIQEIEVEETLEIIEEKEEENQDKQVSEEPNFKAESPETATKEVQGITADKTGPSGKNHGSFKGTLYSVLGKETYTPAVLTERKKEDGQLKELYEFWDDYKLNAVGELIRLERLQEISDELSDTNKFYYYGSVDPLGRPAGKGLAVYADNTYYFGEWKEGLRHGKGMWLEVAIYTEENQDNNLGVVEHSYSGQWSKDLPNGEGQEHFSYDYEILEEDFLETDKLIANVIGTFKDGYYHGDMYVMTTDAEGNTLDWSGNCKSGVWDIIVKGNTTDAVWQTYEHDGTEDIRYYYLFPKENRKWGILGLKK